MIAFEHRRKWWILLFVFILFGGIIALTYKPYLLDFLKPKIKLTPFFLSLGERTLIIAPHPDDETLGGGGIIMKALHGKKDIRIVVVTTGDGYHRAAQKAFSVEHPVDEHFRKLGELRHEETIRAMKSFGVPEDHILFLGYPDGGMNSLWESNWEYNQLHQGLNGFNRAGYPFVYEKNAPYCGANVVKNLESIIQNYKPTDIVYPDPEDQHHDHWATHGFVKYTLTKMKYTCNEWNYLVHRGEWPQPWAYEPNQPLLPPKALAHVGAQWIPLPLSQEDATRKYNAIHQYPTQMAVMSEFLYAFVRKNDLIEKWPRISLPVVKTEPDFRKAGKLPYQVLADSVSDTIRRELEGEADLRGVGAVITKEGLYLALETRRNIHPHVEYDLHVRTFRNQSIDRMDLSILNGSITARTYAVNSLPLPANTLLSVEGNRIWIKLPPSLVDHAYAMMINAETFIGGKLIDKTAWQLIDIHAVH